VRRPELRPAPRRRRLALAVLVGLLVAGALVLFLGPTVRRPVVEEASTPRMPATPASAAADELLSLLDKGEFEDVFEHAGRRVREGTPREAFVTTMHALRSSLGAVRNRLVVSESMVERNPDGVVGPYQVRQYTTAFDAGARREVLVLVAENDAWRLYSYNVAELP